MCWSGLCTPRSALLEILTSCRFASLWPFALPSAVSLPLKSLRGLREKGSASSSSWSVSKARTSLHFASAKDDEELSPGAIGPLPLPAIQAVLTHRKGLLCLDKAFFLVDGHSSFGEVSWFSPSWICGFDWLVSVGSADELETLQSEGLKPDFCRQMSCPYQTAGFERRMRGAQRPRSSSMRPISLALLETASSHLRIAEALICTHQWHLFQNTARTRFPMLLRLPDV